MNIKAVKQAAMTIAGSEEEEARAPKKKLLQKRQAKVVNISILASVLP